ncbi:metalloprotease [Bradyrhizobium sp. SRL28]|nr:metalloprotease [Bradyrhizobium sp. SRL28]
MLTATGTEPVVPTSGNRDFDYALAHTLSRMTDVFEVLPGFGYYDDGNSPNAYATPAVRMRSADGTVLFGRSLLRATLAERDHPDVAVSAVCAHEYAHILQYKKGLIGRLLAGQSTVKRVELHADYLAGFFAGARKLQKPEYPAAVYATKAHSIGDYMFTDRNHHGTPDERAAAIVAGFNAAYRDRNTFAQGIETGITYVQSSR